MSDEAKIAAGVYFDDFAESNWRDQKAGWPVVKSEFAIDRDEPNVLFASYVRGNYDGDALVLFEEGGKLFRVDGSHCSCCGLEGQWEPEETTAEALMHQLDNGLSYGVIGARKAKIRLATKAYLEAKDGLSIVKGGE